MLLGFLCKWLGAQLLSLDVHGGTKESDIIGVFEKAEYNLVFNSKPDASVIVFLDEVNTCAHMGLLNEIICHRSIYGRRLKDGIQVLAALNPYRTRPIRQEAGLTFSLGTNPLEDPMNKLVYRVHPIPATLKDFIFDFGSLESATELLYIKSMVTGNERIRSILKAVAALKPAPTGTIVANKDDLQVKEDENTFSLLISAAQNFVREAEGDPSVVSLRDVKRVLLLFLWFHKEWMDKQLNDEAAILKLVPRCIILALAHVYCYRLPTEVQRLALWDKLSELLRNQRWIKGSHHLFRPLATDNIQETIIDKAQNALVSHLEVEEGISMNQALTENLFVSIIAILNKIPIFIVGKPGTSKTLALQVIQNNLQGRQSPREYWRDKPSVHIFQYQCSPLSTSHSIKYIFEAARSFQEHSSDVLTVLLLDEVGLAENSPDLPLKVLHYMLVDPPVAIIGLSNWTLDSSKMNRAICLQRPELSEADIIRTGYSIISNSVLDSNPVASATAMETDETALKTTKKPTRGRKPAASKSKEVSTPISVPVPVVTSFASAEQAHPWVKPLGRAFWRIYNHQNEMLEISRDFIGMRDYYCMLKQLRTEITTKEFSPQMLTSVICRNFSGHPKSISQFLPIFYNACFPQEGSRAQAKHDSAMIIDGEQLLSSSAGMNLDEIPESIPSAIQLVSENVTSQISRNLMILSKNDSVLSLLFGCGILNDQSDIVLIGSRFRDDLEEIHLIQQINKVKQAMAEGKVAVLLNNDSIYESLYDVLNQRYVTQRDFDTGTERRMLRLAMGSRSQLCPVKNGFKLIVVVNQAHAYEKLDLPLLNRFEKQIISPEVALQSTKARRVLRSLEEWCASVMEETRMDKLSTIFCGLYADTLSSLILSLTGFGKQSEDSWTEDEVLKAAQNALLRIAVPASVLYSRQLQEFIREDVKNNQLTSVDPFEAYMTSKSNIFTHLEEELRLSQGYEKLLLIATKSPVNQFEANFHNTHSVSSQTLHQFRLIFFQLAHVTAERNLTSRIDSFYEDISFHAPTILAILCDPLYCHESIIAHARYLAAKAFRSRQEDYQRRGVTAPAVAKHVLFVVHLPQGVSSRVREFSLDFYSPWSYSFLDDLSLQSTTQQGPNLMQLLRLSLFNLCDQGIFNLRAMMIRNFQSALAQCHQLTLDKATLESQYVPYVKILFELLKLSPFVDHLYECLLHCLRTLRPINNIEFQVYRACENLEGSLKQSIEASIENIVTNGLGHVLRQLDGNFRISTLYRSVLPDGVSVQTETLDLWLRISRILHPPESIARLCPADLSIPAPSDALVFNSSLHGAYIARFAFSDRILAFLNEPLREALEQKFGLDFFSLQRSLHAMIEAVVGPELYLIIARISSNNLSYLYDFVISSVPPQQYVRFEDQYSYVKVVMECMGHPAGFADSPIEYSPDVVHAKYWCAEGGMRFFYTFSAWSSIRSGQHMYGHSLFLPDNFELSIIEFVAESLSNLRMSVCETSLHMTNRLREVDLTVIQQMLLLFLNSLDKILQLPSDQQRPLLSTWTRVFSLVRTDFEALLALAVESNLSGQIQYKILQQWWLLSLVRAVCTEMVDQPEFDASLFTQLHTQMHTVIDPTRPESLDSFIAFSDTHSRHRSQLIKCYLRKFLLPESQFLQRLGSTASLSQQLVRRVGSLLIVQDGKMVDDATDADESIEIEETALLRTATDIVCKYAAVGDVKEILCDLFKTGSTTTFRVAQLYMERNENDLYNSQGNLVMDTSVSALIRSMVNVKSTAELHSLLATHPTDILSQLVYVKSAVSEYAYTVSTFILNLLSTTTTDIISAVQKASLPVCPLPDILGPKGLLPAQVYFFTQLLHKGGKKALLLYLRFKKAPVLLPGITLISPTEPMLQTIDPFSGLTGGELYYPACSLILQLKYQHGVEKLKSWYKENATIVSKLSDRLNILIAALFTQLISQKTLVSKSYLKQLIAFFQEDIAESSPECVDYHLYLDVLSHFWSAASDKTTHNATIQTNLKLHILLLALSPKSGWLRTLFQNPKAFVKGYLPSMIDDEFAIFKTVTDAKGDIVNEVGWYECSNGHKYSVGNCMRPMEVATCPSCGVSIGGRDHTSVAGVRNLANDSNFGQSLKGYSLDSTATPQGYNIVRLGKLTTVILRFIIHTVMLCASEIYPKIETKKAADSGIGGGAQSTVVELMYPDSTADSVTIDRVKVELNVRLTADWKEIETLLDMEEENLAMGFHMVIKAMMGREVSYSDDGSNFGRSQSDYDYAMMLGGQAVHRQRTKFNMPPENMSPQLRAVFEQKLEIDIVNKIFASPTSKRQIRDEKARFQSDNVDVQLTRNLNEWSVQVLESDIPEDPLQYTTASLWRVRQVVTFNEFCRCFRLVSANEKSFPVLAAILQYEKSLSLVKLATHILAWHALLFKVFQPGSLTRSDASALTNKDVIALLPENERNHAELVMNNFCDAFNAVITQPGNLRECAENVFIDTSTGQIDLDMTRGASGSFKSMGPDASLSFSLPSSLKDGNEFVDPRALCTLFILDKLKVKTTYYLYSLNILFSIIYLTFYILTIYSCRISKRQLSKLC